MFRRSIGSGRAEEPASLVFPAWVTAIFSPLWEPSLLTRIIPQAHLRVAKAISGFCVLAATARPGYTWRMENGPKLPLQGVRVPDLLAGPGRTLRDYGAR